MLDLNDVVLVALAALAAVYWYHAVRAKERVVRLVRLHCDDIDVQLLDETVALARLWVRFDGRRPRLWRAWQFEFSTTGTDRATGRVLTLGREIEVIQLDTGRLH